MPNELDGDVGCRDRGVDRHRPKDPLSWNVPTGRTICW
jgi:hypothetical protein